MKETMKDVSISMVPLCLFIIVLMAIFGGYTEISFWSVIFGMVISVIGFALFIIGVRSGLLEMGELMGISLMKSRYFGLVLGIFVAIGFSITFAEPGVMILSRQVDVVSSGVVKWYVLAFIIAIGIGTFLGLALLRMVLSINIKWLFLLAYSLIIVLSFFTNPLFLPLAFDASGVTTGPLTVPFILSLGIGMNSVRENQKGADSFGFIALASIGPILGIMLLGVFV